MSITLQPKIGNQATVSRRDDNSQLFAQAVFGTPIQDRPRDADGRLPPSTDAINASTAKAREAEEKRQAAATTVTVSGDRVFTNGSSEVVGRYAGANEDGGATYVLTFDDAVPASSNEQVQGQAGLSMSGTRAGIQPKRLDVNLLDIGAIPQPKTNVLTRFADSIGNVVGDALGLPESEEFAKKAPFAAALLNKMGIEARANGEAAFPNDAAGGKMFAQFVVEAHAPGALSMTPGFEALSKFDDAKLKRIGFGDDFISGFNEAKNAMSVQGAVAVGTALGAIGAAGVAARPAPRIKVTTPSQVNPPSMGGQTINMVPNGKGGFRADFPKDGSITTGSALTGGSKPLLPERPALPSARAQTSISPQMVAAGGAGNVPPNNPRSSAAGAADPGDGNPGSLGRFNQNAADAFGNRQTIENISRAPFGELSTWINNPTTKVADLPAPVQRAATDRVAQGLDNASLDPQTRAAIQQAYDKLTNARTGAVQNVFPGSNQPPLPPNNLKPLPDIGSLSRIPNDPSSGRSLVAPSESGRIGGSAPTLPDPSSITLIGPDEAIESAGLPQSSNGNLQRGQPQAQPQTQPAPRSEPEFQELPAPDRLDIIPGPFAERDPSAPFRTIPPGPSNAPVFPNPYLGSQSDIAPIFPFSPAAPGSSGFPRMTPPPPLSGPAPNSADFGLEAGIPFIGMNPAEATPIF